MRLLNTRTMRLCEREFFDDHIPPYAILSHTWGEDEVTLADINGLHPEGKAGFAKIKYSCQQAIKDGIAYAWVDTCCIDKSSSAELSEAINSMFRYYENAECCYAYLVDVQSRQFDSEAERSRWFTRGWTLQELLAPSDVRFFTRSWQFLGTRNNHAEWLSRTSSIQQEALGRVWMSKSSSPTSWLNRFCVAQKMCWASKRTTTRKEDIAYCLLGLFGINMPLLYGEGDKAFERLQHEILKISDDQSIFAWNLDFVEPSDEEMNSLFYSTSLLASHPTTFANCKNVQRGLSSGRATSIHNGCIESTFPIFPVEGKAQAYGLAVLNAVNYPPEAMRPTLLCMLFRKRWHPNILVRGTNSWKGHTLQIDFARASAAVPTKVVISTLWSPAMGNKESITQIFIHEATNLTELGYSLRHITFQCLDINDHWFSRPVNDGWDQASQTFTLPSGIEGVFVITFQALGMKRGYNAQFHLLLHTAVGQPVLDPVLWCGPVPDLGGDLGDTLRNPFFVKWLKPRWTARTRERERQEAQKPMYMVTQDGTCFTVNCKLRSVVVGQWELYGIDIELRRAGRDLLKFSKACRCDEPRWVENNYCFACHGRFV